MPEVSSVDGSLPASPPKASASAFLTLGGLAAAFGVAACCALPLLLTQPGARHRLAGGIASVAAPIRPLLLMFAALALAGGAILLWRQQRHAATCGSNGVCTPLSVRILTLVGLILGVALLITGYLYA